MKYYKYQDDESPIGSSVRYIETENNLVLREINFNGADYFASNINYPRWGLCLADQPMDFTDEVTPISKEEFDYIWNAHLATRQAEWISVKSRFPVTANISGFIQIFYPQGVIVNLDENALGVADYAACKASTRPENMYTRHKVTAVVKGYDEENQWVVLESPQVHPESVPYPGSK